MSRAATVPHLHHPRSPSPGQPGHPRATPTTGSAPPCHHAARAHALLAAAPLHRRRRTNSWKPPPPLCFTTAAPPLSCAAATSPESASLRLPSTATPPASPAASLAGAAPALGPARAPPLPPLLCNEGRRIGFYFYFFWDGGPTCHRLLPSPLDCHAGPPEHCSSFPPPPFTAQWAPRTVA